MTARVGPGPMWAAYLTGGFGLALNAMMSFLLPLRAIEFGVGLGTIGLLLGVQGVVEAVASIPVGGLIDRIGSKRAFVIGTSTASALIVGYGLADSLPALFVLQFVIGFVRPLAWVGSQTYVAGMREGTARAVDTGRLAFVATAGQIVGPLIVGFAAQAFGVRQAFFAFAAYCMVFVPLGLVLRPMAAPASGGPKRHGFGAALGLLRHSGMRVAIFLTVTRLWVKAAWASFFPLLLVTGGATEGAAGTVVAAMALVATILSPVTGRLARNIRVESLAAAALGCGAVGLALSPFIDSIPTAYAGAVLVGIGHGLSLPSLLVIVSRAAPEDQRGLALGLRSGANQGASALAPPAVAAIIGWTSPAAGYPIAGGIAALLLAGAMLVSRARPRPARESATTAPAG